MGEAINTALEIEWRFNSNNGEVCYFDAEGADNLHNELSDAHCDLCVVPNSSHMLSTLNI